MSTRIEAEDINEAYALAMKEFNCSIKELDIEIIQTPSNGFLGFFQKKAIVEVKRKDGKPNVVSNKKFDSTTTDMSDSVLKDIEKNVIRLMNESCFDIEVKLVEKFNENTVLIKLDGADAALIIGKEGYRYNSLVTLLYNWLHIKYSFLVRLEVSEFLKTQEESVLTYLENIYPFIEDDKRVKTKILDGILLRIALNKLKEKYPHKFIRVRNNHENKKYILVDNRKEQ